MALNSDSVPTFLDEFRSLKLNGMLRDVQKLTPEELLKIKEEIDKLLTCEEQNA